jgi:hypothetical protein
MGTAATLFRRGSRGLKTAAQIVEQQLSEIRNYQRFSLNCYIFRLIYMEQKAVDDIRNNSTDFVCILYSWSIKVIVV